MTLHSARVYNTYGGGMDVAVVAIVKAEKQYVVVVVVVLSGCGYDTGGWSHGVDSKENREVREYSTPHHLPGRF